MNFFSRFAQPLLEPFAAMIGLQPFWVGGFSRFGVAKTG